MPRFRTFGNLLLLIVLVFSLGCASGGGKKGASGKKKGGGGGPSGGSPSGKPKPKKEDTSPESRQPEERAPQNCRADDVRLIEGSECATPEAFLGGAGVGGALADILPHGGAPSSGTTTSRSVAPVAAGIPFFCFSSRATPMIDPERNNPLVQDFMTHRNPAFTSNFDGRSGGGEPAENEVFGNTETGIVRRMSHHIDGFLDCWFGLKGVSGKRALYFGEGKAVLVSEPSLAAETFAPTIPVALRSADLTKYFEPERQGPASAISIFTRWIAWTNAAKASDAATSGAISQALHGTVYALAALKAMSSNPALSTSYNELRRVFMFNAPRVKALLQAPAEADQAYLAALRADAGFRNYLRSEFATMPDLQFWTGTAPTTTQPGGG